MTTAMVDLTPEQRAALHCPEWCVSDHTDAPEVDPRDPMGFWITHDSEPCDFGSGSEYPVPVCQTRSNLFDGTVVESGLLLDNTTLSKAEASKLVEVAQRIVDNL